MSNTMHLWTPGTRLVRPCEICALDLHGHLVVLNVTNVCQPSGAYECTGPVSRIHVRNEPWLQQGGAAKPSTAPHQHFILISLRWYRRHHLFRDSAVVPTLLPCLLVPLVRLSSSPLKRYSTRKVGFW